MPLYDFKCDACLFEDEVFIKLQEFEELKDARFNCPQCALEDFHRVTSPVALIGPMPSKPFTLGNTGKTFESKQALDNYCKTNNVVVAYPKDREFRDVFDRARTVADTRAKERGFSSVDDFRKHLRVQKAETQEAKR